jgi:hypothetical protein
MLVKVMAVITMFNVLSIPHSYGLDVPQKFKCWKFNPQNHMLMILRDGPLGSNLDSMRPGTWDLMIASGLQVSPCDLHHALVQQEGPLWKLAPCSGLPSFQNCKPN